MANYSAQECLKSFRTAFYDQDPGMMPYQFRKLYGRIPIWMPDNQKKTFAITRYVSGYTGSRRTEALNLRRKIKSYYGEDLPSSVRTWLESKRLAATFAGHGLPEELSLVTSYAVYCGYKSAGQVVTWAQDLFGLDCCGFANAYFTAIKSYKRPLYYIPSYTQHGGFAKDEADLTWDSAICFARIKGTDGKNNDYSRNVDWQVRPNPGNGSHVMVMDCWAEKNKSIWVTQMSATYGLNTHEYTILKAPEGNRNNRAIWRILRKGKSKGINVMFSLRMPELLGKEGET